jgi:K+-sensing histidine kinase KdpD
MQTHWTRPSLARDFAVLAASIFFLLGLIAVWIIFTVSQKDASNGIVLAQVLQLMLTALFFFVVLWVMHKRLLQPLLIITSATRNITQGQSFHMHSVQGSEEIHALALQIDALGKYIEENKRIENELRNKVFMLRKSKESTETAMRSKSEFLAYVCQEIRTVLNHIIGFSQTMRDQMHGPIENRKYRQYAADIYTISNTLLGYTQDLLTFSKTETGYVTLMERSVNVSETVNKALRFMADKMQVEQRNIKPLLHDALPKLVVDELRLQQILTNALLYLFHISTRNQALSIESKIISENRDKQFFVIVIGTDERLFSDASLLAWAEKLFNNINHALPSVCHDTAKEPMALNLELVKSLIGLHQGYADIEQANGNATIALFFPGSRIRTE